MPEVSRLQGVVEVNTEAGERGLDRIEQRFRSTADAATRMSPAIDGVTSSLVDTNALVNEAVTGLDTLNESYDAQAALMNRLAQAQNELNNRMYALGEAQGNLSKNTDPGKQQELQTALLNAQVAVDNQQASVNRLAKEYQGLGNAGDEMKISLADAFYAIEIGQKVVDAIGKAYEATIARAAEWGDEMGDLADLTNQSVEDMSHLAATLELVGIKHDQLSRILKAMNDEGINLTLDRLIALNKAYNDLKDPVEKVQFLQTNFKKSWADMAEVMGRDTAELNALADAAANSGKVIGGETAAQAELLNMKLEQGKQLIDGTLISLGNLAIDGYGAAATAVRDVTEAQIAFDGELQQYGIPFAKEHAMALITMAGGALTYADALDHINARSKETTTEVDDGTRAVTAYGARWQAMGAAFEPAMEAAKEAEDYFKKAEEAAEKARKAQDDAWEARFNQGLVGNPVQQENEQYASSMTDLEGKAAELRGEIDKLTESNGKYYETVQGNGATAAQLELANQKLAAAYKKLSEETDPLKIAQLNVEIEKQQGFIAGADHVVGGYIDNSKKIAELEGDYKVVQDAIEEVKKAHEQATAQIVLDYLMQQLAQGGWTDEEKEAAEKAAKEWGLYEGSMIQIMGTVDTSIKEHGDNANAMVQSITDGVNNMPSTHYIDIIVRQHQISLHQNDTQIGAEPDPGAPVIVTPGQDDGKIYDGAQSVSDFSQPNGGGLGGVTIQIYEASNPQETANAVIAILQDRGLVDRNLVT